MNFQQARGATVPGNANASLIIQRMTSNNNPMHRTAAQQRSDQYCARLD
jgi:hypothetical protein